MCCSGDGVSAGRPAVPSVPKQDALNVTRLFSGNDSDFMEMTACGGGLMDNTELESESPILSPDLEQENNAIRGGFNAGLVEAHNKSVLYEEDQDVSLTCCVESGVVASSELAIPVSVCASYDAAGGRCLNQMVLLGEDDDMDMTQCLLCDVSTKVNNDMELTQCLPLDVSTSVKSSRRWPFGKRQDGRKEKVSSCDWAGESVSLGDRRPFEQTDDLDVSQKMDTAAFLMELNTMEKPAQMREADSMLRQTSRALEKPAQAREVDSVLRQTSQTLSPLSPSLSTTFLPSAACTSLRLSPCTSVNIADNKTVDTHTMSVSEQTSEYLLNGIADREDVEFRDNHRSVLNSSPFSAAAVESEPVKSDKSIAAPADMSISETFASFAKLDVNQTQNTSTDFHTNTAPEADGAQTATTVASSRLTTAAATCPVLNQVALSRTAASSVVPAIANEVEGYRCQLEKSSSEVEHCSHLADEATKVVDVARPVRFGVDAVESLFAAKEPDMVFANNSTVAEDVSETTAVTDCTQTTEWVRGFQASGSAADTSDTFTDVSQLRTSVSYGQLLSSRTKTDARKPLRNVVPNMVQSADALLTRLKLASGMPCQGIPKVRADGIAAEAYHSSQLPNSAVKQNLSTYGSAEKSLTSSFHIQSSTAGTFLDRAKEFSRYVDVTRSASTQVDVSGCNSRMELSAQRMELTDTLPTNLVSFSLTENLDATKLKEMHLEPALSSTLQLTSSFSGEMKVLDAAKLKEMHIEPILSAKSRLTSSCGDETRRLDETKQEEMHLEPVFKPRLNSFCGGGTKNLDSTKQEKMHLQPVLSSKSQLTGSFSGENRNLDATKREEMHLEPVLSSKSQLMSSCGGETKNLDDAEPEELRLKPVLTSKSQLTSSFTGATKSWLTSSCGGETKNLDSTKQEETHLQPVSSSKSQLTSSFSDENRNLDATKREEMHLEPVLSSKSQLMRTCGGKTKNLDAAKPEELHLEPVLTSKSQLTSSFTGDTKSCLTSSSGGETKNLGAAKSENLHLEPVLSAMSRLNSFCDKTMNLDSTKGEPEEMHLELVLSSQSLTGCFAGDEDSAVRSSAAMNVEFPSSAELSSQSGSSLKLPAIVVCAPSCSQSVDEYFSSLPTTDISESSVFSSADSDANPTRFPHDLRENALPTSVSINKVYV